MDYSYLNNDNTFVDETTTIQVFNYKGDTREFFSTEYEEITDGTGIPQYSCVDAPPDFGENQMAVRSDDNQSWKIVVDFRGKKAYNPNNSSDFIEITKLNEYYDDYIIPNTEPDNPYSKYQNNKWIIDEKLKSTYDKFDIEDKAQLYKEATTERYTLLTNKLQLDIITDTEKEELKHIIKYYQFLEDITSTGNVSQLVPFIEFN